MKVISLSQNKSCIICDCHYAKVKDLTWHYAQGYARTNLKISDKWKSVSMNRYILDLPDGLDSDHINRNTLDNRCNNLRAISRSRNKLNSNLYRNNKTGTKGISRRRDGFYTVNITVDGERKYLGFFRSLQKARYARATAEEAYNIY